ncbi:RNase A-like domain-containing protein [Mycobacteroides abscessus]|uniref:RNase A-like domain-containing protein n=1 Tax=Mycobacteroides abscessus TaxID=36809 RepID=UPI00148FCD3E|nr:hypothetical protein [Mycobacteroides abscessus]
MSRPRKSDVYKANATALGDLAKPLREAARTLRGSAQRVYTTIDDFDWLGDTREAAVGRAERDMTQNRVKADHLDALAEAYENGSKTMQPMIEGLKSKGQGLEGNTFEVSEDWKVTDKYDYAAARRLATMMDPDGTAGLQAEVDKLQARRANEATAETGNLQKLADELGVADTNTDTAIGKALAALGQAPGPAPAAGTAGPSATPVAATPTAGAVDPATVDPKVLGLLPGIDPSATKPGTPAESLPDLLAAASKTKPTLDPNAGSLTDKLLRIDPTMAARQTHVEKIPGVDPNSPAGQAGIAAVRNLAQAQGLTPAQVEAKVQDAIKASSQDRYVTKFADPNAPSASPSEHVSRDFGEQFNRFTYGISESATHTVDGQIEQAKILAGQGGPGQPTAAEAWKELGINAAHQVHELTTDPLAAPKIGIEQAKDFINSPSEFIGKNIIHGTEALATGAIGGEAAAGARGLLGDLTATEGRALTHELTDSTPAHHTPAGGDHTPSSAGDHGGSAPAEQVADTGHIASHGLEDIGALLTTSESSGGHLIERHVGQTLDDLSARLDSTRLPVVSSFGTTDEAAAAVSSALQRNQQVIDEWLSNGAVRYLELDAPFSGGAVLERGSAETVVGTGVRVVLKGDGNGGWYVLTGFPTQ